MSEFCTIVANTIKRHKLLENVSTLVVGVSGGADSVALLLVLYSICEQKDTQLVVAHLNHGLREEAEADEKFVKELATNLDVSFFAKKVKIKKEKVVSGCSVEMLARNARHDFFRNIMKKNRGRSHRSWSHGGRSGRNAINASCFEGVD